jgi:hypothetical protein
MFFNRIYFTTRQSYRRLKNNRKITTFHIPGGRNGQNGGQGGPNYDYTIIAILMSYGFYCVNKKS